MNVEMASLCQDMQLQVKQAKRVFFRIMLGHEQYSGYIQKIRHFLTSGVETKVKERRGRPYLSKFSGKQSLSKGDVPTWVDLFLEKEVHVVGFSFDYTENHLWNLLMKKERLSRKDDSIGKVYFHRCSDHKQNVFDEALLSILASLGTVVQNHVGSSYERAYTKFMEYVKQIIH